MYGKTIVGTVNVVGFFNRVRYDQIFEPDFFIFVNEFDGIQEFFPRLPVSDILDPHEMLIIFNCFRIEEKHFVEIFQMNQLYFFEINIEGKDPGERDVRHDFVR